MSLLLVDSYDSFTYNLKSLLQQATGLHVHTIHNDTLAIHQDIDEYLSLFTAIVIGPGPGNPKNKSDVGILPYLLNLPPAKQIPILGICLGFQCIASEHGNEVVELENIRHGQIFDIHPVIDPSGKTDPLLDGMPRSFKCVRYHSLHIDIRNDSIVPLAYCLETDGPSVLMAGKHRTKPMWGVQYHPESICSEQGKKLVQNFIGLANDYNRKHRILSHDTKLLNSMLKKAIHVNPLITQFIENEETKESLVIREFDSKISPIDLCDSWNLRGTPFVLLNSASSPGEWSIIGCPIENESPVITHSTENPCAVQISKWTKVNSPNSNIDTIKLDDANIWKYVASWIAQKYIHRPKNCSLPFLGGLVGYFSYEEGAFIQPDKLESLTKENIPDTKLVFIERCILYSISSKKYFVVSIRKNDHHWIKEVIDTMSRLCINPEHQLVKTVSELVSSKIPSKKENPIEIELPDQERYSKGFNECQTYLRSGNSYELCYTTQAKLHIPKSIDSWSIYKVLTSLNPSPYSSFMQFSNVTLLSSSPERFLAWKHDKSVQLRPIKGTVKKTPQMTFEKATSILKTPKEMGENLMIVDLIRHDLYAFLENVEVSKLMNVEEYATVYQLVSVIEGDFATHEEDTSKKYSGIDILSQSLPPGSMTGAPKKRSVEILQNIESNERRGIYSGVAGYWSITDDADWSVVIRSVFSYEDDLANKDNHRTWRIGAGGAITVLSECESEWEEMCVKLSSALQAF